jgi:hypothetical protein
MQEENVENEEQTELIENAIDEEVDEALQEEEFPGAKSNLRRDNPLVSSGQRQHNSVLQTYIYPTFKNEEFRAELKRANWLSLEEADEWCNAFEECNRYGAPVDWLINRLIAHSAGVSGGTSLMKNILETISHTTFNLNKNQVQKKRGMFNRNGKGPITE